MEDKFKFNPTSTSNLLQKKRSTASLGIMKSPSTAPATPKTTAFRNAPAHHSLSRGNLLNRQQTVLDANNNSNNSNNNETTTANPAKKWTLLGTPQSFLNTKRALDEQAKIGSHSSSVDNVLQQQQQQQQQQQPIEDFLVESYRQELTEYEILKEKLRELQKVKAAEKRERIRKLNSMHIYERIAFKKEENALKNYERRMREWDEMKQRLAQRLGKDVDELVMNRAQEYREKLEEFDLLEKSIPAHIKHGIKSWELSLRGGSEGSGGVRYVKIGSDYPYPLYCPVNESFVRDFEIVRHPFEERQDALWASVTGIREHTRTKFKRYIQKILPHDPSDDMYDLKIEGVGLSQMIQDQLAMTAERQTNSFMETEEVFAEHHGEEEEEGEVRNLEKQVASPRTKKRVTVGPDYEIDKTDIIFNCERSTLCKESITVVNTGSCSLFYQLEKEDTLKDPTLKQRKEIGSKNFHLCSQLKGSILPGEHMTLLFSFNSDSEGIYSENWKLTTVPSVEGKEVTHIRLKGTVIERNESHVGRKQIAERLEKNMNAFANASVEKPSSLTSASEDHKYYHHLHHPPPQDANAAAGATTTTIAHNVDADDAAIAPDLFYLQNQGLQVYYSPAIVQSFQNLATKVFEALKFPPKDSVWDFSLESLAQLIQSVDNTNGTRDTLGKSFQDLVKAASYPPSEQLSGIRENIFYYIGYDLVLDAIDQIAETAQYLEVKILGKNAKAAPSSAPKAAAAAAAGASGKPPGTPGRTNRAQGGGGGGGGDGASGELAELTPEQKQAKEKYHNELVSQAMLIVSTSIIDRFDLLAEEAEHRFGIYVSEEQNRAHAEKQEAYRIKMERKRRESALKIQSAYRGYKARRLVHAMREAEREKKRKAKLRAKKGGAAAAARK